jgi:hypothetical protein
VLVPEHIQARVLSTVWEQADAADWDHLSQAEKARLLEAWIASEEVGGLLRPLLLTDAAVRLWLKDVAIKKRARARMPSADIVVHAVMSAEATVVDQTEGIKPHHCEVALDAHHREYVCWGAAANAKHLYWAALNAVLDDPALYGGVVVFIDFGVSTTTSAQKARLEALAKRCGIDVKWLVVPAS